MCGDRETGEVHVEGRIGIVTDSQKLECEE